jgi:hypothetical protein
MTSKYSAIQRKKMCCDSDNSIGIAIALDADLRTFALLGTPSVQIGP